MPDPIIHIGLPKTGTTFIQNEVLAKSEHIFYVGRPYTQEGLAFNMIQYCDDTLYDETVVRHEIDKLKRRAGERKIVISDELLAGSPLYGFRNRSSIARRLHHHFPNAQVVLCLRNQVDILASYFRQITAMGWNEHVLDERYVHGPGAGLSLDDWRKGAGWDASRRFVSHQSLVSVEYFKYVSLYDLYDELFDEVSVQLFEDFRAKSDQFFETWASVAEIKVEDIRRRSEREVNVTRDQNMKEKILSNRVASLLENISFKGKGFLERAIRIMLQPFFDQEVIPIDYLQGLVRSAGIPEDNRRLAARDIADVEQYPSLYLLKPPK